MATLSSILAWRIPWTEKPDGPQSLGSQSWTLKQLSVRSHTMGKKLLAQCWKHIKHLINISYYLKYYYRPPSHD